MNQEPTQEQTSQTSGAPSPSGTSAPREENTKGVVQQKSGGILSMIAGWIRGLLGAIFRGATASGTENPEAQTTRSQAGGIKNFIMKLFGKAPPLYDAARSMKNTPWEKKRGNDYSKTYDSDGRLSLTLRDGVLGERALQMLAALDASDTKELDPSSAGIGKFPNIDEMAQHSSDKKMCDKLLELRKRLQENGNSLEVINSSDGFGKVLKITIDPRNKTVEQIQKEITDVFSTLGIGGPQMAESIAKELVRSRDSQRSSQDAGMSSTHAGQGQEQARPRTVNQELGMSSASGPADRDSTVSESQASSRRISASSMATQSAAGIDSINFSLSGNTSAVPSSSEQDYSVLQGQFLSSSSGSPGLSSASAGQAPGIDMSVLRDAAEGMDVVSGVSNVDMASSVAAPTVSGPESTSQSKGPLRGM